MYILKVREHNFHPSSFPSFLALFFSRRKLALGIEPKVLLLFLSLSPPPEERCCLPIFSFSLTFPHLLSPPNFRGTDVDTLPSLPSSNPAGVFRLQIVFS